jgi:hypothetical protein
MNIRRPLGRLALGLLLWTGCAAPPLTPATAYVEGKKAAAGTFIAPPATASEQRSPALYYRSLKSDARSSPDRYYAGPVSYWKSQNFRQGFIDGLVEALEGRAQKADATARGTADDHALGRKMALDLGPAFPDVDFKTFPDRFAHAAGGIRLHLALDGESYYRTAYVDTRKAKGWTLQTEQFRAGFVEGFLELCAVEEFEAKLDADRAARTPAEDYDLGVKAGKRAAELVDVDQRKTLRAASEEHIRVSVTNHYKAGADSGGYDPAKESTFFQQGFSDGFKAACGLE